MIVSRPSAAHVLSAADNIRVTLRHLNQRVSARERGGRKVLCASQLRAKPERSQPVWRSSIHQELGQHHLPPACVRSSSRVSTSESANTPTCRVHTHAQTTIVHFWRGLRPACSFALYDIRHTTILRLPPLWCQTSKIVVLKLVAVLQATAQPHGPGGVDELFLDLVVYVYVPNLCFLLERRAA